MIPSIEELISALEKLLHTRIGAMLRAEEASYELAIAKAEMYAAGVEGKSEEIRKAHVTLATVNLAKRLTNVELEIKSLDAAIEIARLRVNLAMQRANRTTLEVA